MKKNLAVSLLIFICSAAYAQDSNEVKLPEYKGVCYTSKVPDTLDLAQRCSLAASGMTTSVDPNKNYLQYFYVIFGRDPVYMAHSPSDGCTRKFIEALPFQRVAGGNMINPECEKAWIAKTLQLDDPTNPENYLNGRLISAAGAYYTLTGNESFKNNVIRHIEESKKYLVFDNNSAYLPRKQRVPGADTMRDPNKGYFDVIWTHDGLVKFYRHTGYKPALELAGQLTRAILSEDSYYYHGHHDGSFAEEPVMWPGVTNKYHFHVNTLMRIGVLEYAAEVNDKAMIEWVHKGYEFGKQHGDPITGWFPEAIAPGNVNAVYNICEMCCVGDMVQLAVKLAQTGYDYCWDDADRWIRNMLAEGQLTDVNWVKNYFDSDFCKSATAYDKQNLCPDKSYTDWVKSKYPEIETKNAASRNIGCFGGWVAFNDWFGAYNINSEYMQGLGIMHCCTGNASRALYAAWYNIVTFNKDTQTLKVNLLLNRASKYADIDSHIPYNGRVDIKLKQDLKLEVRIPDYVTLNDVKVTVDSKPVDITFNARYAQINNAKKGQTVTVIFPLKEETKTVRLRYYEPAFYIAEYYTLKMKGNTVIDISPKGKWCPLYQRDKYKSNETKYIDAQRFVCDKELPW
jgi:hypothetical protein